MMPIPMFSRLKHWLRPRRRAAFDVLCWPDWKRWLKDRGITASPGSGIRARQIYQSRPDLRQAFPLGLTPVQLPNFATWLIDHGRSDPGISETDIAGFIHETITDPGRGLFETYSLTPAWQEAVPSGRCESGWSELIEWVRGTNTLNQPRLDRCRFPQPSRSASENAGVNLLGHFRYPSGLQEEARHLAEAFEQLRVPLARRDLPVTTPPRTDTKLDLDPEVFDLSIYVLGAFEFLDDQMHHAGIHPRPGVHRVVYWNWEQEQFPREPLDHATMADEIWAPSPFVASSIRQANPGKPVFVVPPAVSPPIPVRLPRSLFGLPDDLFLFLFAFDMGSIFERKNPLALIDAFRRAFPIPDRVHLAIKVSRADANPDARASLLAAAGHGVTIIDRVFPRSEFEGLLNACDAYVSLHRSEGFGFGPAEAMMLGKPVIATDYSATADYLTVENGFPVHYRLVPLERAIGPFPQGSRWAEPDVDHAAELMRFVFEKRDVARSVAAQGQRDVMAKFSRAALARRLQERISDIRSRR